MLAECLRFLERVATLYEAGIAALRGEDLADIEQDSWRALETFLGGYAYERQGASPAYTPAAAKTIQTLASRGASWREADLAKQAWRLYVEQLKGQSPNELNNPMCPKGTPYRTEKWERATRQPCVIEFIQAELSDADYNIVRWAKEELRDGKVQDSHGLLKNINGVGDKIASLFLRDVALVYGIAPDQSCELLQPIDRWVKRYIYHWEQDDSLKELECAHWIVERSLTAGVSPERVNAGMWHFGARVVDDRRTLLRLIDDVEAMQKKMEYHVNWMASQVDAWRSAIRDV